MQAAPIMVLDLSCPITAVRLTRKSILRRR